MSGRRDEDRDVTIWEVYRRLVDMDAKLDAIDKQVRITNGRTTTLEAQMLDVKQDIRDIKPPTTQPPAGPSVPIMTPEGESLSIKVSPKMWVLIASAFGSMTVFAPMVAEWFKQLFGK